MNMDMKMKYFSVPSDFKKETIDKYHALNCMYNDSRVIESYGNITFGSLIESGRSISQLPGISMQGLQDYVKYSREKGIEFNYTMNAPHMQNREFTRDGAYEIKNFLNDIYEAGVRALTITLPSLIDLVKSTDLDFKLKASAICSITNVNKAMILKKKGVAKIVVEQSINRDFHTLAGIRKYFGPEVEMIVNSPCHIDCAFRMLHYNQNAADSLGTTNETSFNYYEHQCMLRRYENLGSWLKLCWVRPEDLKYYTAIGINHFKLQGRQTLIKGGNPLKTLEYYFKEDFDGNLIDLINLFAPMNSFNVVVDNKKLEGFIKPFVKRENFCTRDCSQCSYCDTFVEKCIDLKEAEEISELARRFYREYDEYEGMVNHIKPKKVSLLTHTMKEEGDFEF
jgi:hypothetical protein